MTASCVPIPGHNLIDRLQIRAGSSTGTSEYFYHRATTMHRKKPVSGKQHKAQLQAKRARKRVGSEPQNDVASSALPNKRAPTISTQRRLESSFVRLPATLLDQSKAVAASVALVRPIIAWAPIWTLHSRRIPSEEEAHMRAQMTCMRRPKWRYEMSKKEVEKNEEGLFAKWLAKSDSLVEEWVSAAQSSPAAGMPDAMPMSPSVFERNLEVWRQLCVSLSRNKTVAQHLSCSGGASLKTLRFSWFSWIPVAHCFISLRLSSTLSRFRVTG